MLIHQTKEKLIQMKMAGMCMGLEEQQNQPKPATFEGSKNVPASLKIKLADLMNLAGVLITRFRRVIQARIKTHFRIGNVIFLNPEISEFPDKN